MKRVGSLILGIMVGMFVFVGCSGTEQGEKNKDDENIEVKNVKVIAPDGLPGISLAKLAKENTEIKSGYNVEYSIEATSDTLSTSVMKEEPDLAIVPSNMAAIAYNKTSNYEILGTVGLGSFYLVSSEGIENFEDLVGKEVGNTGKGLTPDITLQALLKNKDINVEEIDFNYVNAMNELVPLLVTNKLKTGIVAEPALTSLMEKNKDIKIIESLNDEWKRMTKLNSGYPQSTLIVKSSFVKENPEFVSGFIKQISEGISWANTSPDLAGNYAKEIGVSTEPSIITKSMERANLNFINISDMEEEYKNYYQTLFDFDAKAVGGKIPDEGIYYKGK
ncbi:MAG: ABC transporter substrate-binding protein [Peptostreptococcaceae bacterium]